MNPFRFDCPDCGQVDCNDFFCHFESGTGKSKDSNWEKWEEQEMKRTRCPHEWEISAVKST